jgi:Iron-containing redox enzyme
MMQGPALRHAHTASWRLRRKIELVTPQFALACQRVFTHPRIAEVFPQYLLTMYSVIRTTVPLTELAIARARSMAYADPVAEGVAGYLTQHVEEERHHDGWLLDDLELMGLRREAILAQIPSPSVASLTGSQYYWIMYCHPVALLGYFAFMEGAPPTQALIETLIRRTGFPRKAFHTMALHGELDPGHRDDLDRIIDSLPLSRDHEVLLGLSVISTGELLARSLDEVVEDIS